VSEIEYVLLRAEHAKACEELELSVFATIDPVDLYHERDLLDLAAGFPEGNFVALDDGRPIGMGLGILVEFDLDSPLHTLRDIEGEGGLGNHAPENPWYYGTDISVYPKYRGRGIGRELYQLRKDYVRSANKLGIVAGGVLPGYADHLNDMTAQEYIDKVRARELYDPTLTFQMENGFEPRIALPGYVTDPSVGNNSVLIVWENPDHQPG
jgi:GNAT superfamily N-acetyltransferase